MNIQKRVDAIKLESQNTNTNDNNEDQIEQEYEEEDDEESGERKQQRSQKGAKTVSSLLIRRLNDCLSQHHHHQSPNLNNSNVKGR